MQLVPPTHPLYKRFYNVVEGLEGLKKIGEICVSMGQLRMIMSRAVSTLGPAVRSLDQEELHVFGELLNLSAQLARHLYSEAPSTPMRRLRFRTHGFLTWLLVVHLSAHLGGRKMTSGKRKNHARNCYFKDLVEYMPHFEETHRLPWPCVSQEEFERQFKAWNVWCAQRRKTTDLLGYRKYSERLRQLAAVRKKPKASPALFSSFADTPPSVFVLCPSVWTWQLPPLPGSTAPSTAMAGVNLRKFLHDTVGLDGQGVHIRISGNGDIIFDIGSTRSSTPPQRLCFKQLRRRQGPRPHSFDTNVKCKCTTGKCTTCACFLAKQACGVRCGHGGAADNCSRPSASAVTPPVHANPACTCAVPTSLSLAPAVSLAQWAADRVARGLWPVPPASRAKETPDEFKIYLEGRLQVACTWWKHAHTHPGRVTVKRDLRARAKWCLRRAALLVLLKKYGRAGVDCWHGSRSRIRYNALHMQHCSCCRRCVLHR